MDTTIRHDDQDPQSAAAVAGATQDVISAALNPDGSINAAGVVRIAYELGRAHGAADAMARYIDRLTAPKDNLR